MNKIPFNLPIASIESLRSVESSINEGKYEAGKSSKEVGAVLQKVTGSKKVLLTHSCTAALEMAALLCGIKPGDEVIMPSFTFVSTANAFVLRGAKPVFIDISPDTLNIDENLVEAAITDKTKAIVPVHYAGVACNMDMLLSIAKKYNLMLIEDAAQCVGASYKEKHLGSIAQLGTLSFHYTKNFSAGFGGALLINDSSYIDRAKVIYQRGTNREAFLDGEVDKYTWIDTGSSFVMAELSAALLLPQLEKMQEIVEKRVKIYNRYYDSFNNFQKTGLIRCPFLPEGAKHNAHIFYLTLSDRISRRDMIKKLRSSGIEATSHYQPLHQSRYYQEKYGTLTLPITEKKAAQIIRLPLYGNLLINEQSYIIEQVIDYLRSS